MSDLRKRANVALNLAVYAALLAVGLAVLHIRLYAKFADSQARLKDTEEAIRRLQARVAR
jgi:hypothetical protein